MNWMAIARAGTSFITDSIAASSQRKWTSYNNKMINLQAARSFNTIQQNRAGEVTDHVENEILIQTTELMAKAKVKVAAATAGVAGGSVEASLFNVGRNAGKRLYAEETRFENAMRGMDHQATQIKTQAALAQKQLPTGPSVAGLLLNMGSIALKDQQGTDSRVSNGTLGLLT